MKPTLAGFVRLAAGCALAAAAHAADRPNIVLINADDLGYVDLGCYGNEYHETPHIDRLAADGLRFTQAYSAAPLCAPSRIGMLSGLHPARAGCYEVRPGLFLTQVNLDEVGFTPPENRLELPENRRILPEYLRDLGYRTAIFGKWHAGSARPTARGFDEAVMLGMRSHLDSAISRMWATKGYPEPAGPSGDYLADCAARFIERGDGPFFLYLAFTQIHTVSGPEGGPLRLDPEPELFRKYTSKKGTDLHRNPGYAAMVEALDRAVGRVMTALRARGLMETTLVVFSSDNGGLLGARRVTESGIEAGEFTSNHPLSGGKAQLMEGGIRVPLSFTWPGRVRAGAVCDAVVSQLDLLPTLLEVAGAGLDARKDPAFDGRSIVPLLRDADAAWPVRDLVWHYPGYRFRGTGELEGPDAPGTQRPASAIRRGDWKLTESLEDGSVRLVNLADDMGETADLAGRHPERVMELTERLRAWRATTGAPMPEPKPPRAASGG